MAYCSKCGTLLSPGDRFCHKCGNPTEEALGPTTYGPPGTYVPPVDDGALDTISILTLLWGAVAIILGTCSSVIFVLGSDAGYAFIFTIILMPFILSGIFSLVTYSCAKNRRNYRRCIWCCALSSVFAIGSIICFIIGIAICVWLSGKKMYFTS